MLFQFANAVDLSEKEPFWFKKIVFPISKAGPAKEGNVKMGGDFFLFLYAHKR